MVGKALRWGLAIYLRVAPINMHQILTSVVWFLILKVTFGFGFGFDF
jgi:hypothetical protein